MEKPFDIFWFGEGGPTWIDAVATLESAKARIERLPQPNSGAYAVLDQRTGRRISFAPTLTNHKAQPADSSTELRPTAVD
jgi:hypothetical protein